MKKILVLCIALSLVIGVSCANLPKPPEGCENAISYKIPGFIPFGPGVIRLGIVGVCAVQPTIKPAVLVGLKAAYTSLQNQQPKTFVLAIIQVIEPVVSFLPAVDSQLQKAKEYFSNGTLTICDRDILAALAQNIYRDLTGSDIWD